MIKITIPYSPVPTPPKITSPNMILIMAIIPANGERLSCMAFTEPLEAAVVMVDHNTLLVMPSRASFPSINGIFPKMPFVPYSEINDIVRPAARSMNIVRNTVQPCLVDLIIFPYVKVNAAGISRMASISKKLLKGVGFSNGCALLALKKPPPFVPSCLMAICEATGPAGITCCAPSMV